ncbi:MAG TPA: peptidoglycan binding domain-containing protein, partial [Thermomicrobiaceae bacterium]|nr:peptidoglycan binding domain-containing protein [Thermomicrobiaceae bacterium]
MNDLTERLLLAVAMAASFLFILTGAAVVYGRSHGPTFYRGLSVVGVDLSGLTLAQAQARLDARVASSAPAMVTLAVGARRWSVSSASLGARYDTADSLRDAYALGRSGNPLIDSRVWLQGLFGGYRSPLIVEVDTQATYRVLEQVAAAAAAAPVNARYALGSSGGLTIDPGKSGTAIDVAQTELALTQRLADLSTQPVNVELVTVPPSVTASRLQPGLAQASRFTSAPLILTAGDGTWELGRSTLRSLVTVDSRNDAVGLDPARLRASIGALATQVDTPARNPT